MKTGVWKGTYAATNPSEYWAEGVQSWFHCNRTTDSQHTRVNDRDALRNYDAALARLMEEVFRDNNWTYIPPSQRQELAHLRGLDRTQLPTFRWSERIKPQPAQEKTKPASQLDKPGGGK